MTGRANDRQRLVESIAFWLVSSADSRDMIASAARAVAAGDDDPVILTLASRFRDESRSVLGEDAIRVLEATGRTDIAMDRTSCERLAGRYVCHEWLESRIDTEEMLRWFHDKVGHTGPETAQELVALDDEFRMYGSAMPTFEDERRRVEQAVTDYLTRTAVV